MLDLSPTERMILVIIQRSTHPLTEVAIQDLADVFAPETAAILGRLEALKLIRSARISDRVCFTAVPATEGTLFGDHFEWLTRFCAGYPRVEEGDTEAMTCTHCGIILLAAVVAGTRDEQYLANVTSLPVPFVQIVCALGDKLHIWGSSTLFQLREALIKDREDFENIRICLTEVDLTFWQPDLEPALTLFRCGHQFGNRIDAWKFPDAAYIS